MYSQFKRSLEVNSRGAVRTSCADFHQTFERQPLIIAVIRFIFSLPDVLLDVLHFKADGFNCILAVELQLTGWTVKFFRNVVNINCFFPYLAIMLVRGFFMGNSAREECFRLARRTLCRPHAVCRHIEGGSNLPGLQRCRLS